MDGKKFLIHIRDMNGIINSYEDELDVLMTRLTSTTSKPKDVNVMFSREDTLPENIEKVTLLKEEIKKRLDEFAKMRIEADTYLRQIDDFRLQTVISKYYFQSKTLEQIAVEIGKSYQWTCELRDRAVEEFEKIMKKSKKYGLLDRN